MYSLIITDSPPYSSSSYLDALELALAASNVNAKIKYLFYGAGILQLHEDQEPSLIDRKSAIKKHALLSLYDIEEVYLFDTGKFFNKITPHSKVSVTKLDKQEYVSMLRGAHAVFTL